MRVIGGNVRGRRLKVPKSGSVRPTAARVKESLFNILPHDLTGLRVLDLFAGTGNLTIEALSRGAAEAILIDASAQSGDIIHENLRRLGLSSRTKVWISPVSRALRLLARRGESFDLLFLDPPYEEQLVESTLQAIAGTGLLRGRGILVAEHSRREPVKKQYGDLALDDQRRYGSTVLSFFRKET